MKQRFVPPCKRRFALTTILVNRNSERTNVILGRKTRTVLGPGVIEDTLAGVPLRMGVHEFLSGKHPRCRNTVRQGTGVCWAERDGFSA